MNLAKNRLDLWITNAAEDSDLAAELAALSEASEKELEEQFSQTLAFGTGGLRGIIGAGTNCMNIYTVRKATQGVADYLNGSPLPKKAAIAYDSRVKSDLFARETARVFAANGIEVNIFSRLMPTPALSYAVRVLGCGVGICVTASHNPALYNGYKVYGADGGQITMEAAEEMQGHIENIDPFINVKLMDFEKGVADGKILFIEETVLERYLEAVLSLRFCQAPPSPLKVVYTPLNGAGRECVTRVLRAAGYTDVALVPQQAEPDGQFPTCPFPNPERPDAMALGTALAQETGADLVLATDPDCDRVGVCVKNGASYQMLTGNEIGVLLLDYICGQRLAGGTLPEKAVAVKTIVTTDMACAVAQSYNVNISEVLTGFKYIGEQISLLEQNGRENEYILGFEESNGYLSGTHVRDKDGVNAALLICEMAAYHLQQGHTLVDAMAALYERHGYWQTDLLSFDFPGLAGMETIRNIMGRARKNGVFEKEPCGYFDYLAQKGRGVCGQKANLELPASDVVEYRWDNDMKLTLRPSGTEPKLKIYLSAAGKSLDEAKERLGWLALAAKTFCS